MSYYCRHSMVVGRCPRCDVGYVPPGPPDFGQQVISPNRRKVSAPRLNLDRFGMPKDYATYVWLLYRRLVDDRSPARMAFLRGSMGPSQDTR